MSGPNSSPASPGSVEPDGNTAAPGSTPADHPPVFLSATSADLGGVRRAAKEALLALGYYPVEQSHFGPAPGEILQMLDDKIARSAGVIHIVGECHGADPEDPHPARSYTQHEYDLALRHGKPLYIFVCGENFPYTPHAPESDARRQLQFRHRERVLADHQQYVPVASPEDLLQRLGQIELRLQRLETHAQRAADEAQGARAAAERAAPAAWWAKKGVHLALLIILALGILSMQQWNARRETEQARREAELRDKENKDLLRRALGYSEKIEEKAFGSSGPSQGSDPAARLRAAQIDTAGAAGITLDELLQTLGNAKKQSVQSGSKDLSTARLALASGDNTAAEAAANRYLARQDAARREALILRGNAQFAAIKYPEAEASYRTACALVDRQDSETWADTQAYLAKVLDMRGAYGESLAIWREILPIREKKHGPDSVEGMIPTSWIAAELWKMSKYEDAEKLLRRVLEIREKTLGPAHLDVATACNNLGLVLRYQGSYTEAERYLRRALEIREKALAPAHRSIATACGNLGIVLIAQGNYVEAERYLRRALEIDERALGPAHPDVAVDYGNLGVVLGDQGNYAEAERYRRRALEIHEKAFGSAHPSVAISRFQLGSVLREPGQQEEAGRLLREGIAGLEARPDFDQSYLGLARWRLAQWHERNGRAEEARAEGVRALEIHTQAQGEEHPYTKKIKEWLDALGR